MKLQSSQRGFTLIEVIIAIVILAIALMAIYQAVQSSVNIDTRLKGKIAAHDIAMTVISNLQAGLASIPEDDEQSQAESGFNQLWQTQITTLGSGNHYTKVAVTVRSKTDPKNTDVMQALIWKTT